MATLTPLPLPQSFEDFCALFLLFIAYSTLGWCGEMIYCSVPKGRLCEKLHQLGDGKALPHALVGLLSL